MNTKIMALTFASVFACASSLMAQTVPRQMPLQIDRGPAPSVVPQPEQKPLELLMCERQLSGTHEQCDQNARNLAVEGQRTQQVAAGYANQLAKITAEVDYYRAWFKGLEESKPAASAEPITVPVVPELPVSPPPAPTKP